MVGAGAKPARATTALEVSPSHSGIGMRRIPDLEDELPIDGGGTDLAMAAPIWITAAGR